MEIKLRKGLDLPIKGEVTGREIFPKKASTVAVVGTDYIGMKPTMQVKEGDTVKIGQPLFSCKKNIGVVYTSPAAGTVKSINRGEKRAFESVVISVADSEERVSFSSYKSKPASDYTAEEVKALLLESGAWTSLRQRPFEKVAEITATPASIFVTASDTNPLAPNPQILIDQNKEAFAKGLKIVSKLTAGKTYLCTSDNVVLSQHEGIERVRFSGPHPAGNVGTHIHFLDPVNPEKSVWHIGYQDVVAIGHLFATGELYLDRLIALVGPYVKEPKLISVRRGACISEVTAGEIKEGARVISGSVLHGQTATGPFDFLGHYVNQISALEEDPSRVLLGWHSPGFAKFSNMNIFVSRYLPGLKFNMGTSTHGSARAIVPIGAFEKIMPLDILATPLLKSLASNDVDAAQDLGCLELAEEDLALCTFVSTGKTDFGPLLRKNLQTIEKEG